MNKENILRDKNNELVYIKDDLVGFTGHQTNNQHPIFYLGKGQGNKEYCDKLYNLTLVSGCVGSGMSLYLETLVLDLANRYSPDELKFILLDPGGFQYPHFAKLPHLISPIMTDMADSKYVFTWLVAELQRRYKLLEENKVRYTEQYNEKNPENKLPHIVLISYQFAESLITNPESIEKSVIRLAQLNKSAGIYPILVSSRPSTNIFTGLIKANTSAFVSFALTNEKDSQEFIGIPDAKNLNGKGDMLYISGGLDPIRIQAEYLPHEEISKNIEDLANKYPQDYDKSLMSALLNKTELRLASEEPIDDLIEDAKQIVTEEGSASASLLQRKLQIGYARAARLLDKLNELGVVGSSEGSKPRKIINTKVDKELIVKFIWDTSKILDDYIAIHDRRLREAGTAKSVFRNLFFREEIDFKNLYEETEAVLEKATENERAINTIKETDIPEELSETLDTLSLYAGALKTTCEKLKDLTYYQHEVSEDIKKSSWDKNKRLEKEYKDSINNYLSYGEKLNRLSQKIM